MQKRQLLTLTLAALAAPLAAQTTADSTHEKRLETIVVSAARSEGERFATPEKIEVITARQIERTQARTTPEALFRTVGVFVQKTNHGGGSPFVRGLTGNQTLLLLDGIRLNNATFRFGPNQYLNTVDAFPLEKIEVFAGGGSTQFGSDAFGGTVALFSRMPDFSEKTGWRGQVIGRLASQKMEQTVRGEADFSSRKVALAGGITSRSFGDLVGGDTTGRQSPSGYREIAFDLRGRFFISKKWEITASHRLLVQREVPVFHKVKLENFAANYFEHQVKNISWVKNEWRPGGRFLEKINLTLAHQFSDEQRVSRKNGSTTELREADEVRTISATTQADFQFFKNMKTVVGAEFYLDFVGSSRSRFTPTTGNFAFERALYPDGSTMTSAAVFALHDWRLDRWTISGGLRWNGFDIRLDDEDLGSVRVQPSALVGSAGVLRRVGERWAIFASFNAGFRAPNVDDLGSLGIVDFRFEVPNYALRPEKSANTQAGFRFKNKKWQLETALFRNELGDLIARVRQGADSMQGYPVYQKINSERGYVEGVEASVRWRFLPNFSAEGWVAYAFGHNLSRREPLRRIPPLNGRAAINFEKKRWSATAELLSARSQTRLADADRADNRIPPGGTPGWAVVNVSGGWASGRMLSVWLTLQNLGNADYRYHGSGINGVGRSAVVSVVWRV